MIPLVDLKSQYRRLRSEMLEKLEEIMASAAFIQGRHVAEFEAAFRAAHGFEHGAGCSNGTAALFLALLALGMREGDEVITTTATFVATAEAICHVGAKPVFVDIDPRTYQIDPVAVEAAITPRTRAIIPVHLYGNPAEMDALMEIGRRRGLKVIEDAAQAHLATYRGRCVGNFGDAATFSFYPGKNLGAYGDAGFIVSRTAEQDRLIRRLLDHGRTGKYVHEIVGHNHRMDALQAGVLSVKLRHLEEWTQRRRDIAAYYDGELKPAGYQVLQPTASAVPSYHLYPVQVANRDETLRALKEKGVEAAVHYPIPLHLQPAFAGLKLGRGSLPVAERLSERVVSLPLCAELTDEQAEIVVRHFRKVAHA